MRAPWETVIGIGSLAECGEMDARGAPSPILMAESGSKVADRGAGDDSDDDSASGAGTVSPCER